MKQETFEKLKDLTYRSHGRCSKWPMFSMRLPAEMIGALAELQDESGLSRNELIFQILKASIILEQGFENPQETIRKNMTDALTGLMQDLLTQAVKQQHQTVLKKTRKKA